MSRLKHILVAAVVVALLAASALAGGCMGDTEPTDEPAGGGAEAPATGNGEAPTDDPEAPPAADPDDPDADDGSTTEKPASPPENLELRLYWVSAGENALGVDRTVPYTTAVATAALNELLAGPTAAEKSTWPAIDTAIPEGTRLLGVRVEGGVAKVDLSKEFASGGGTFSVTARIAQVVYTLTQFPTVTEVEFYIDGVRTEVFSSEGLILDRPQRPEDYYELLPIDA
jgi:hypothetical protein